MVDIQTMADALSTALGQGIQNALTSLVDLIPNVILAVILFLIGWGVAIVIARAVNKILKLIDLEKFIKERRLSGALGKATLSNVLEKLAKYYVILVFLQAAVALIHLGTISAFLNGLLAFAPVLVGAGLLVVIAALAGELVKVRIIELGKASYLEVIGSAAKVIIIFLGLVASLQTIGFDVSIFQQTFLTLLNGVVLAIGLAVAIAFGLGGQADAKDMIKTMRGKLNF
jgi:hypothetical protein